VQGLLACDSCQPGDDDRVRKLLEQAYHLAPRSDFLVRASACFNLAESLVSEPYTQSQAVSLYGEALRVHPNHVPSIMGLRQVQLPSILNPKP
jgi:hypothetical protein